MKRSPLTSLLLALLVSTGCDSQTAFDADPPVTTNPDLTAEEHAFLADRGVDAPDSETDAARRGLFFSVSRADVKAFADDEVVGRSRLIRLDRGVLATVRTSELEPGTATTLWAVVFNAPENCSDGACGADDLRTPEVEADLIWVGGTVIGRSGRARFLVYTPEGATHGSIAEPFLGLPAHGVQDTRTTEVHYVLRTHGRVIPGLEGEMTYTFNGGCQRGGLPDDPRLGAEGPNTCSNVQFAIHLP